jgi:hypothetical protein
MQDEIIGYADLDEKLIIKTDNLQRTKEVFEDEETRKLFSSLTDLSFGITTHTSKHTGEKEVVLELIIERGINDIAELRSIYHGFYLVLSKLKEQQ